MTEYYMLYEKPDAASTPRRLYQALASQGGGTILFLEESAKNLNSKGWTYQEIELTPEEAQFISSKTKSQASEGQKAFLAVCDGVSKKVVSGVVMCGAPDGLERIVLQTKDVSSNLLKPAEQFLPKRLIGSVFAFKLDDPKKPISAQEHSNVDTLMRSYREVEEFYRAYSDAIQGVPAQGEPGLYECNKMTLVGNTLARLAQPVHLLRRAVGIKEGRSASPLFVGRSAAPVSSVFVCTEKEAAARLLAACLNEVKNALAIVEEMREPVCKRLLATLSLSDFIHHSDRKAIAGFVQAMNCRTPTKEPSSKIQKIVLGGIGLAAFAYIGVRVSRQNPK